MVFMQRLTAEWVFDRSRLKVWFPERETDNQSWLSRMHYTFCRHFPLGLHPSGLGVQGVHVAQVAQRLSGRVGDWGRRAPC